MTLMNVGKVILNGGTRKKVKGWSVNLIYKAIPYRVFFSSRVSSFIRLKAMIQ